MRSELRAVLVCLASLYFAGCGGLQKEADQLLEEKNYQDALGIYERILQTDPSSAKALNGRKQARTGVIEQGLIEVRLKRLSGQKEASLQSLDEIVNRVSQWSLYPEGAVAFTQKEEMNFASKEIEGDLDRQLHEFKPFKAQWTLQRWAKLFPAERLDAVSEWQKRIADSGKQLCGRWGKGTDKNYPFYTRFVLKSCRLFSEQEMPHPRAKEQFAWLEPRFIWLGGVQEPEFQTLMKERLQEAFRRSPWYDESSETVLFARMEPKFEFELEKKNVKLTHAYLVKVPYESAEMVDVTTWVPEDRVVTVVGLDGKARTEVVRDSKRVTNTELKKLTRYRDEVRHIPYEAIQFDVSASLNGDLRMNSPFFDEAKKGFFVDDAKFFIQHGSDSPEVGLKPSFPKIPNSGELFVQLTDRLAEDYSSELRNLWKKEFCGVPTTGNWLSISERVHRCLHGSSDAIPEFIERWMRKEIGLTYGQWYSLAGGDRVVARAGHDEEKLSDVSDEDQSRRLASESVP